MQTFIRPCCKSQEINIINPSFYNHFHYQKGTRLLGMLISHQITLVLYFGKTAHEQQKHLFKGTKKMLLSSAEKN